MGAPNADQNLQNHTRWVPGYHYVTATFTLGVLVWTLYRLAIHRDTDSVLGALIGVALTAQFWYLRAFPLAVQDRVIRLEEQLRLRTVLPADQHSLAASLTANQLIALRFASDAELPALAKRVAEEKIAERAKIKALVVDWRADHMRA